MSNDLFEYLILFRSIDKLLLATPIKGLSHLPQRQISGVNERATLNKKRLISEPGAWLHLDCQRHHRRRDGWLDGRHHPVGQGPVPRRLAARLEHHRNPTGQLVSHRHGVFNRPSRIQSGSLKHHFLQRRSTCDWSLQWQIHD